MNPVLRELQRQLNDIAKQLDDLQRQETLGGGGSFGSKFAVVGTSQDIASFEVDGTYARVYFVSYRDSALTHGEFKGRASRGSKDSPAAIQSGDLIFAIRAEGYGTDAWPGGVTSEVSLEADGNHTNTSQPGRIVFKTAQSGATGSTEAMRIDAQQRVGIGATTIGGKAHIDQASTTAAIPVLVLDQADLSEEFIEFTSTVGAGNPIDTAAIGTYYGKIRVNITGVGYKYIALYNT